MQSPQLFNAQSLYDLSVKAVAKAPKNVDFKQMNPNMRQDVFLGMLQENCVQNAPLVARQLNDMESFAQMLRLQNQQVCHLHKIVQKVIDGGVPLVQQIAETYAAKCQEVVKRIKDDKISEQEVKEHCKFGLNIALFFADAGWSFEAQQIYSDLYKFIESTKKLPLVVTISFKISCGLRLANMMTKNHSFQESKALLNKLRKYMKDSNTRLHSKENIEHNCRLTCNKAQLFNEFSLLFQATGAYDKAKSNSALAFKMMTTDLPPRVVLDILKQGASVSLFKNELTEARNLLAYALELVRREYGDVHPITIEVLEKYGEYLIKNDEVFLAAKVTHFTLRKACQLWGDEENPHKKVYNMRLATLKQEKAAALLHHPLSCPNAANDGRALAKDAAAQLTLYFTEDHSRLVEVSILEIMLRLMGEKRTIGGYVENFKEMEKEKMKNDLEWALGKATEVFGEDHLVTAECYHALGELNSAFKGEVESGNLRHAVRTKEKILKPDDVSILTSKIRLENARLSIALIPMERGPNPLCSESWCREWFDQYHSIMQLLQVKYANDHSLMIKGYQACKRFLLNNKTNVAQGQYGQLNMDINVWYFDTQTKEDLQSVEYQQFVENSDEKQTLTLQQLQQNFLENNNC